MAIGIANALLMVDGDAAFLRVNNRVPAHALQPGEVAAATNCRFEQGKPCPRLGVARDEWGNPGRTNVVTGSFPPPPVHGTYVYSTVTLEIGRQYRYTAGNESSLTTDKQLLTFAYSPAGDTITPGMFTATQATYYIWTDGAAYSATITTSIAIAPNTCAYKRFNDPVTGTDNAILITDDWRDAAGEDGGRGRAWRILPGNGPQEISLNGHDVWSTARLVQADKAMLLLRHGNERHYFVPADLDGATDEITLHCAPSWGVGTSKRVRFEPATDGAAIDGTTPPAAGNYYYARAYASNVIKLYPSSGEALAETGALDFETSGAVGKFFIELAESPAPYFGNGAPVLILEPSEIGNSAFEAGFEAVRSSIEITDTDTDTVTCPNHHFAPGDAVTPVGITIATAGPYYAYPIDADTISLHTDDVAALTGASPLTNITASGTGSIAKTGASGLPLPPCREGAYVNGRLWGINERDTIVFSDPYDYLHFTQFSATLPANQGEAGRANWLLPLGEDAILIGKDQKLILLTGVSGDTDGWRESTVTSEYGGIAALAAGNVGTDGWFLSRKGVASVIRTAAGEKLGVPRTVSENIPQQLQNVDWLNAASACSETWNGRYFIALPTKGQSTVVNNQVLVCNFNNANLSVSQGDIGGDIGGGLTIIDGAVDSWEGIWNGDLLVPYAFARLTIGGEERLTFATPDGLVFWLHDGWDDAGAPIASEILTRGYFGGREMLVLKGKFNWDSFNPLVTASIVTAGVNEEETLSGFDELEYDRTAYLVDGADDYDPGTSTEEQFSAPDRSDYSPTPEELMVATLDTHQSLTEPFRCRVRGNAPQLRIVNEQGSLRLASVSLQAKPVGIAATRKS